MAAYLKPDIFKLISASVTEKDLAWCSGFYEWKIYQKERNSLQEVVRYALYMNA
jgi:hypothetical protein